MLPAHASGYGWLVCSLPLAMHSPTIVVILLTTSHSEACVRAVSGMRDEDCIYGDGPQKAVVLLSSLSLFVFLMLFVYSAPLLVCK